MDIFNSLSSTMTIGRYFRSFSTKIFSVLFISKWSLILINVGFIFTAIIVSSIIWANMSNDFDPTNSTITESVYETMISTRRFGIVLISIIVTLVGTIGITGAIQKNINMILFYDFLTGLTLLLMLFGWRNYQHVFTIYISILLSLITILLLSLVYKKTIKREPYKIRQQLLMNSCNNRESFIF